MDKKVYLRRQIDDQLQLYLDTFGAVLLRGPKWCGKTTTAEKHAKSVIKMQDSRKSEDYLLAAQTDISLILDGENPRLIDEWQAYPKIWDAVRTEIDEKQRTGLYILTGSRVPAEGSYMHSGAGRIGVLFMRTMSLFESGDSNGTVSLSGLFSGKETVDGKTSSLSVRDIAYCLCRGGWPENIGLEYSKCALKLESYLELIYESDDMSLSKYAKDVDTAKKIVRSYSRNISSLADTKTIYEDTVGHDVTISESKFNDYMNALKNVFIIDEIPAWNPSVRSRTAMRAAPKRELIDPSIAALYMGITPDNITEEFRTFGLLFESLCLRDLKVYASGIGGEVFYYRDRYGLEADAVIVLRDGRYCLAEVKLGSANVKQGAENLSKLEDLIIEAGLRKPEFRMVVTGGELAYTMSDGTYVVPVGCLRD